MPMHPAAARCHAGSRCRRTPCFRVELCPPAGEKPVITAADACAEHLGDTVQALSHWTAARGIREGHLCVSAVDAAPCGSAALMTAFPFARIPVAS